MITAGEFRNGRTFEHEGNVFQIVEFQHVKPGKGAAFVRTKMKNIVSGGVVEKTFRPTEKLELAHIDRKEYQGHGPVQEFHLDSARLHLR